MFRRLRKLFSTTSDRVKAVEFHPTEPILAAALYNGTVVLFNTNDMSILRTLAVDAQKPIRCVRWMPSVHWLIAAGDNLKISCFDYHTGSLITSNSNAHNDFIRQIAVHPTQQQFLTCSDDGTTQLFAITETSMTIKRTFEGHEHFVMDVKFNPKDPTTFATASLDCTIKFWGLTTNTPRFTLAGHEAGVNCIEFFPGSDRPHVASGSDDFTIRIWDYQTKSCVVSLPGHRGNVTALRFHAAFPLLFEFPRSVTCWQQPPGSNI
jgi:coatomer subunit beta'